MVAGMPRDMRDLTSPFWIKAKGALFLATGLTASALIWLDRPTARVAFLLCIAVWAFCRFYYFAFYVIENYVDPSFRFSGILSLLRYFLSGPSSRRSRNSMR